MKQLVTVSGNFTEVGQTITLNIPNLSEEAAFRLHRETAQVSIIMIADPAIKSTHSRSFQMIGTDVLPDNFVKYIGSFPFAGTAVHIVEVASA